MTKDTVNIQGKEYETVASRVKRFREEHGDTYSVVTELVSADDKVVVMKASIMQRFAPFSEGDKPQFLPIATGYAEESRTSSTINRTSALENCETSAIGRALAAFGMAGTEYASADEVAQAVHQQGTRDFPEHKPVLTGMATEKQREAIKKMLERDGIALEDQPGYLITEFGVDVPLTKEGASFIMDELIRGPSSAESVEAIRD